MVDRSGSEGRRTILSPLGVVSLFLSFTEVVLGYAVTQTSGWIQGVLTAFVVLFPVGICVAFFRILWVKPFVFYTPTDFGPNVDVSQYVEAMSTASRPKPVAETISARVEQALQPRELESAVDRLITTSAKEDHTKPIREFVELVRSRVEESIKQSFVRIDSTQLLGVHGPVWDETYEPDLPVFSFLDSIWRHLQPHVGAYTYSKEWVLRDAESGRILDQLGRPWARQRGLREDERPISDGGVRPNTTLEVVRP